MRGVRRVPRLGDVRFESPVRSQVRYQGVPRSLRCSEAYGEVSVAAIRISNGIRLHHQ
jgi:hypothetical protein